jgi:xanthine dehydrogenase iron-sulfur cluster and FAD-binding subunit A
MASGRATEAPAAAEATLRHEPGILRIRVTVVWRAFILGRDLATSATLAWLLRERLGPTGLKTACDEGACGA